MAAVGAPSTLNKSTLTNYETSYLVLRTVVGVTGILLPFAFFFGETFFLRGTVRVRGSISAYYHSSMGDLFVGGLCVIGVLLATYMAGERNKGFWLSLGAGLGLLGVVFFPTWRPGNAPGECGDDPRPAGCSSIQQWLTEPTTATIHFVCAITFLVLIAGVSFQFSRRATGMQRHRAAAWHKVFAVTILVALAWAALGAVVKGLNIWQLTPLYLGEVVAIWAFAASWLLAGRFLWLRAVGVDPGAPARPPGAGSVDSQPVPVT